MRQRKVLASFGHVLPEAIKEGASGTRFEWFRNGDLQSPVGRSPYLDGFVFRLSCQVFANWIPADALNESLMTI
jgi:hypothetical protein